MILEHMSDYAQSPYAGIGYFQSVEGKMGAGSVHDFMRLDTAPGVDHVGSGAPANVDMLSALVDWRENGKPPGPLTVVEQSLESTIAATRSLPLCEWPDWPHYNGGDAKNATSYSCIKGSPNALTEWFEPRPEGHRELVLSRLDRRRGGRGASVGARGEGEGRAVDFSVSSIRRPILAPPAAA